MCYRWLVALVVGLLVPAVVGGCGPIPRPFELGFYRPMNVSRLTEPLPSVAVYLFSDERGKPYNWYLEHASISGHSGVGYTTELVASGVTRAVIEGLRARGFHVVDMTPTTYPPGPSAAVTDTRLAITGRVLECGARIVRSGLFTYDQRVGTRITVEAYEVTSGRKLWEKEYSKVWEGGILPDNHRRLLTRSLAHVVEQAVSDPDLLSAITGSGR